MKTILSVVCLFFVLNVTLAQQEVVYSNFLLNKYYYNPAIAGSEQGQLINFGLRKQWAGFEGAPFSVHADFYGSIKDRQKMGYGASIISENMGITNRFGVYLNYAYHVRLSKKIKLGLGVKPGYLQYTARLYKAKLADQEDATLNGTQYGASAFDINFGFNLYSKRFFVMGAMNHLLGKDFKYAAYNLNLRHHFNFIAGYNFLFVSKKSKKEWTLQPSVMIKYVKPIPVQFSFMLKTEYEHKYWLGLIYRSDAAIGINVGATFFKNFSIAYGYDYSIGGLGNYQHGSHEIILSYRIKNKKHELLEKDKALNKSIMEENKDSMNK